MFPFQMLMEEVVVAAVVVSVVASVGEGTVEASGDVVETVEVGAA